MGAGFLSPLDIINRALQHCGVLRISSLSDLSLQAQEMAFAYDKVRRAELRRNAWRFAIRRIWLWPFDVTSLLLVPGSWSATTTYSAGDMVAYGGMYWVSRVSGNLGNTPGSTNVAAGLGPDGLAWDSYFGSTVIERWNVLAGTVSTTPLAYGAGDLVYTTPGDGTYKVYVSTIDVNDETPGTPDAWSASLMYNSGDVVSFNGTNYQSTINFNFGYEPDVSPSQWTTTITNPAVSKSWRQLTNVTAQFWQPTYPIGTGPASDNTTRNIFMLPAGYLRKAPQMPKMGWISWLGQPAGNVYKDWELTDGFIVSSSSQPIVFRFVADVQDVSLFDDMFCEGLAARLALEVAPIVTDKTIDRAAILEAYNRATFEARLVNGIEEGADEPPEDEWISVRI